MIVPVAVLPEASRGQIWEKELCSRSELADHHRRKAFEGEIGRRKVFDVPGRRNRWPGEIHGIDLPGRKPKAAEFGRPLGGSAGGFASDGAGLETPLLAGVVRVERAAEIDPTKSHRAVLGRYPRVGEEVGAAAIVVGPPPLKQCPHHGLLGGKPLEAGLVGAENHRDRLGGCDGRFAEKRETGQVERGREDIVFVLQGDRKADRIAARRTHVELQRCRLAMGLPFERFVAQAAIDADACLGGLRCGLADRGLDQRFPRLDRNQAPIPAALFQVGVLDRA